MHYGANLLFHPQRYMRQTTIYHPVPPQKEKPSSACRAFSAGMSSFAATRPRVLSSQDASRPRESTRRPTHLRLVPRRKSL